MPDYRLILVDARGSRQPIKTIICADDLEALRSAIDLLADDCNVEVRAGCRIVGSIDRAPHTFARPLLRT